jgi:arylsulfatase
MNRRTFLGAATAGMLGAFRGGADSGAPPNILFILADDLGYGDLGCYGSRLRTPNLNRLAGEGALFRQFCSASAVCSPARAALLTGRYGVRVGVPHVLGPGDSYGLSDAETTIPKMLKTAGYRSACIGKWHIGSAARFLPTQHGFDEFYGLLHSNDQGTSIMQDTRIVEEQAPFDSLTQKFTDRAVDFIRRSKDGPFFLYLSHTAPHVPLVPSAAFRRKSRTGVYGDVVEELDWGIGQVLNELSANGLDENTLVIFTSDNGPWFQGSTGRLRGRKGDTFEGGLRVPFLARYKARIPQGSVVNGFATMLDVFPTLASLAGAPLPRAPLDGVDIWPMLSGEAESVTRPPFLYFDSWNLQCARVGNWKLHLSRNNTPAYSPEPKVGRWNLRLVFPELYDVNSDPEESTDMSEDNPEIVASIRAQVMQALPTFPAEVQSAWAATMTRGVVPNQPGVWPELNP